MRRTDPWRSRALVACLLVGCDGSTPSKDTSPSDSDLDDLGPIEVQLTLQATYARPTTTSWDGLDYDAITTHPIRRAEVWVADADSGELIAEGQTDAQGTFTWTATSGSRLQAGIAAHAPDFGLQVVDNTADNALYTLVLDDTVPRTSDVTWEAHAGVAHDGTAYTDRTSGPFAILDTALTVFEAYDAASDIDFPPLSYFWSVDNVPTRGDEALGEIRTTHWDGGDDGIYVLGAEDVDTDEYDATVIAHEWVHYYENRITRSDSKGGSHGSSALLHMSVAMSEGAANALAGITLGVPYYRDSDDPGQADSWEQDLEKNRGGDAVGWYGSRSVSAIVWDLHDADTDDGDTLSLPLSQLHALWAGPITETPALTSLYVLGHALRELEGVDAGAIDALWNREDVTAPIDPWGTGETNDGGSPSTVQPALFRILELGQSDTLDALGPASGPDNRIDDFRYYRYTADDDRAIAFVAEAEDDIDIQVLYRGDTLCESDSSEGSERCEIDVTEGETYVLEIDGTYLDEATAVDVRLEDVP